MPELRVRTYKRKVVRGLVLTLGLIMLTNVSCSFWFAFFGSPSIDKRFRFRDDSHVVYLDGNGYRLSTLTFKASTMRIVPGRLVMEDAVPGHAVPAWMKRAERRAEAQHRRGSDTYVEVSVGWPVRLLWYGSDAWSAVSVKWPRGYRRFFPLRPVWSGQMMLAAVCLALVAGSTGLTALVRYSVARRRVSRGRCAACNYDLRGSASGVCPECGAAR